MNVMYGMVELDKKFFIHTWLILVMKVWDLDMHVCFEAWDDDCVHGS